MRIQWRLKDLRELARDAAGKSSSCFGSTTRLADADKKKQNKKPVLIKKEKKNIYQIKFGVAGESASGLKVLLTRYITKKTQ